MIRGAALAMALLSSSCSLCKCDATPPVLVPGTYVVTDANEAEVLDATGSDGRANFRRRFVW